MTESRGTTYRFEINDEVLSQIRKELKTRSPCVTVQDWILEAIYLRLRDLHPDQF